MDLNVDMSWATEDKDIDLFEEAVRDFFCDGLGALDDEDIVLLAKRYNKQFNQIQSIVIECGENLNDDYTEQSLFDEYQGDAKELGSWFESYVIDCIEQAIEQEII